MNSAGSEAHKDVQKKVDPEQLRRQLEFQVRLNNLIHRVHEAESFSEVMPEIEDDLLGLLNAERITVYQRSRTQPELVSKYKSGDEFKEIRVPLSTSSISGYVGLSQKPVRVQDVYDDEELHKIHPNLNFDKSFDLKSGFRSRAMVVVPIKSKDVLFGVMQVLNRKGGGAFSDTELRNAVKLGLLLGQQFRYELGGTSDPYEFLVQTGKISQEQIDDFKHRAPKEGTTVTGMLIYEAGLNPSEIGASLERYYQVPYMGFDPEIEIPRELLKGINEAYLKQERWLPVQGNQDEVVVLIDDPADHQRIMEIQRVLRCRNYVFKVSLAEEIRQYLGEPLRGTDPNLDINELVDKLQEEGIENVEEDEIESVDENEATVIQLVNQMIRDSYMARASDIHIEPGKGKSSSAVRIRVDGVCRKTITIPASHIRAVVSRIKIMGGMDISDRRRPQDGKCVVKIKGKPVELRVATIPTVNGESVVMRILASSKPLPLEKLNFSRRNLEETRKLVEHPHGIFLVVGPTGSGKTTTLHAILAHINTPERKIWTAEDPVEITQPGLQQVQMNNKAGLNFAAALRAFLRADPDVIMIGEMRDRETAEAGVEASLTGHLVFSTLHTNSAAETVTRLLDLGIDPVSFSDALLGVMAQRLVRTLCDKCKEAYHPDDEELTLLQRYYGEERYDELKVGGKPALYKAVGCTHCGGSGYLGRTGIHELLVTSPTLKDLIYHKATAAEIEKLSIGEGMRTLMQDGIAKLFQGQTDLAQVRKVATK
ncbi:MAG TPA: GspE/PulE family protein [Gammaproteobacteria bacterium]|nr:GspE/PulE family protein [Gammaproteobacteria bacterium]